MKRTIILCSLLLTASLCRSQSYTRLIHQIDSIIGHELPEGTDITVSIVDLQSDSTIYAYRENALCRPASTMKIITAYSGLLNLGADYKFETKVCTKGEIHEDGTLAGDIYLVGGFDPELMESDLKAMANKLAEQGITRINGRVLADVSIMDSVYWGPGWAWDDTPASYQPYITPLICHGGYVGISVKPSSKGAAPKVTVYPQSSYYKVKISAETGNSKLGPLTITRNWMANENTIIVSGNSVKNQSTDLNIYHPEKFTLTLFAEYLNAAGIEFVATGFGKCPSGSTCLTSASHGIMYVMKEMLKESKNLNAESMFLQVSRKTNPACTDFTKAAKFQTEFIKRNMDKAKFTGKIADGSGLSMYDYIPASLFTEILKRIYSMPGLYDKFYDCLPINGVDGTLRGRMTGKNLTGKVHAKTGSVTGACTLAGYAKGPEGQMYAFAIMNSGAVNMSASRKIQDTICTVLCNTTTCP